MGHRLVCTVLGVALVLASSACRDLSGFSTGGGSFEGDIVGADFVRAGIDAEAASGTPTRLCLTLDVDHLQDGPGSLSTSDGLFHGAPLRTIPKIWNDPLSTLTFGEGRLKNLVYVVGSSKPFADGSSGDALAVVSLMQSGNVEVRLLRGAPPVSSAPSDASTTTSPADSYLFAIFELSRKSTPCSY